VVAELHEGNEVQGRGLKKDSGSVEGGERAVKDPGVLRKTLLQEGGVVWVRKIPTRGDWGVGD